VHHTYHRKLKHFDCHITKHGAVAEQLLIQKRILQLFFTKSGGWLPTEVTNDRAPSSRTDLCVSDLLNISAFWTWGRLLQV